MEIAWTSTPSYGFRPFVRNLLIKLDKICQPTRANATEVAQRLGIARTTLYLYLNGDGSPKALGQALLSRGASA